MKAEEIALMRLQNQQLIQTRFKKPNEIISWLGGVQGQDYPGAKWAVGQRLPGSTEADIEQAITEKSILRTWLMRGTLHLVAAQDIFWMLEILAPRIIKTNQRRYNELKLDEDTLKQSNQVIKDALDGGTELNRKELLSILQENGVSIKEQRAPYILQRASLDGIICQCGMHSNNNPIFMSMDQLSEKRTLDNALAELTLLYFISRGPASINDFIWWSGLLAADARSGLEAVKSELISQTINGRKYWYLEESENNDISSLLTSSPLAHLLPTYDEYLFSYQDRRASIDNITRIKLKNRYLSTIALNGQIIGTWKRIFKNESINIEQQLFKTLKNSENHALIETKLLYSKFLSKDLFKPLKLIK